MLKTSLRRGVGLAILGGLAWAGQAGAAGRPAEKILAEIQAVAMPAVPANRQDRRAVEDYLAKARQAMEKKAALVGELYLSDPENDALVELMPQRWQARMMMPGAEAEATKAEVAAVVAKAKNPKLVAEAAFFQVVAAFRTAGPEPDPAKLGPVVDAFLARFPDDPRGPQMKAAVANAARAIAGARRQKEGVGKPFEIAFVDAIKGGEVSSKTLMGKVVVVDFWATWCGPCVAEMPKMKDLYAKYKDKGVEFVGVSLDRSKEDGGYDKLKEYVEKNKIEWPQFYQGNFWESEFSGSWGVQGIPCVFLVDAAGNLAETQARGRLDDLIPEYLAKAKKAGAKP